MDDPSYEDVLDENYELHEEIKAFNMRLQSLENDLSEERKRNLESEGRAVEIERLKNLVDSSVEEAAERQREAERNKQECETLTRTRDRLDVALRERDERLLMLNKIIDNYLMPT